MDDDGIVIPRNSLVEANQSGLIAETIIDITPEVPIPKAQWGPLDSGCEGTCCVFQIQARCFCRPSLTSTSFIQRRYFPLVTVTSTRGSYKYSTNALFYLSAGDCLSIHRPTQYTHTRRLGTDPLFYVSQGEGLVVCDRGKIVGVPGVSMDELVGICTKLAREMDANDGIAKMFATAETAQTLMKNLEPLLLEASLIARELRPMLANVQEQGTLDTIELLAGHATKAVTDIRELKKTILTDENQEMLRQSITIMTKTLQHMEKVSGDISSVSGDPATRQNLRHLIQCLSRLVDK
jgi:hypothetical protein